MVCKFKDEDMGTILQSSKSAFPGKFQLMDRRNVCRIQAFLAMTFLCIHGLRAACRRRWAKLAREAGMKWHNIGRVRIVVV